MAAGHVIEDGGKTWTITLRDGLYFHDREKVRAGDAVASLQRWGKRDVYAISFLVLSTALRSRRCMLQFRLKRPFRLLADVGKPNPLAPVIMPERLALTEPSRQVTEIISSGPYKFLMAEWVPGSLAVYERNAAYLPLTDGPLARPARRLPISSVSSGTPFLMPALLLPLLSRVKSTGGRTRPPTCCPYCASTRM